MKVTLQHVLEILFKLKDSGKPEFFHVKQKYKDNALNRRLGRVGKLRDMTCSFCCYSYNVGGLPAYDPTEKRLFWVYDMDILRNGGTKPQRSIPWDELVELHTKKEVYIIA